MLKRVIAAIAILAGIFIFGISTLDKETFKADLANSGNFVEKFTVRVIEAKIDYHNITGNYDKELEDYNNLIGFYEHFRHQYQMYESDENEKSELFTEEMQIYKEAMLLNLNEKFGDTKRALYCAEL